MNFTRIFNGMVGRDFINAFNDNFTICDTTFLEILATLIYKVKSTDIKEFKVIDGVCSYTLEEEDPEAEEDTRTWIPVDITTWGNIGGTLDDQADLKLALDSKAAADTVETISNLVTTLNQDFGLLKDKVEANETTLNNVANDTADLKEEIVLKVNSTNIKAIRLNNAVFQWSPDGRTWYEQPVVTTISWGHLTGDIESQEDLIHKFDVVNNSISSLSSSITTINNTLTSLSSSVSNIDTTLSGHLTQDAADKAAINTRIGNVQDTAESADSKATTAKTLIDAHLDDFNNPHHVTKNTVGLDRVDNTSDMDKPVSTAQKLYVDTEIEKIIDESFSGIPIVKKAGSVDYLFVGSQTQYQRLSDPSGYLILVLDNDYLKFNLTLIDNTYNQYEFDYALKTNEAGAQIITPTYEEDGAKFYEGLSPDNSYIVVLYTKWNYDHWDTTTEVPLTEMTKNTTIDIDSLFSTDLGGMTLDISNIYQQLSLPRSIKGGTKVKISYKLTTNSNLGNNVVSVNYEFGPGDDSNVIETITSDTPTSDTPREFIFEFPENSYYDPATSSLDSYFIFAFSASFDTTPANDAVVVLSDINVEVVSENDDYLLYPETFTLDSNTPSITDQAVKYRDYSTLLPAGEYKLYYNVDTADNVSDGQFSWNFSIYDDQLDENYTLSLPDEYQVSSETREFTFQLPNESTIELLNASLTNPANDTEITISNMKFKRLGDIPSGGGNN